MQEYKQIFKQLISIYSIVALEFGLMFLLFMVITRTLSQDSFGLYSLATVTVLLLTQFMSLGLPTFIIRDSAGRENKQQKLQQLLSFSILFIIAANILLAIISYILTKILHYEPLFMLSILVILIADLIFLANLIAGFIISEKKTALGRFTIFSAQSLWALPVIIAAILYSLDVNMIFIIRLLFTIVAFAFIMIYLKTKKIKLIAKVDFSYIKKALIFSLPLTTLIVSQWVITASDRYILGIFHSLKDIANYSYIYSLLSYIVIFFANTIDVAVYPYVVDAYNKEKKDKSNFFMNSLLKYGLILVIPSLLGFFLLSQELITMISGTKYLTALSIIPFLIFFPLIEALILPLNKILLLENKTKTIAKIYGLGMALNIVLNFILIPKFSIFGAGIATTATYFLIYILFLSKARAFHYDAGFVKIGRIFISTLIMGLAIAFIHPQNIITKAVTIAFGAIIYVSCLLITRSFVKEEISLIGSFLPWKSEKNK